MAKQLNPYLTFNGSCEEAFNYYKTVFGGEFASISRFKDMPPMPGMSFDEKTGQRLMHVSLPIHGNNVLMGCDSNPNMGQVQMGKNITLAVDAESKEQADAYYQKLADGGQAHMPMGDMFWGAYWGMCTDRFGINWMISFARMAQ
jgi:PhnB protein